jgi:uncharacterized protein YceH (UPF0502 family)
MDIQLTPHEARIVGCLMEKSAVTPDQYPLSLNALVNACNQKSSREPILALEQNVVQRAASDLVAKRLVLVENFGSRVDKYRQRLCSTQFAEIECSPAEFAIICLLLLRGPQTPGELKAHSGRLHEFATPADVEEALERLMTRTGGPYVARLPREPRRKDHAYAHLFCGSVESVAREAPLADDAEEAPRADRLSELMERVARLEQELAALKQSLGVG